MPQTFAITAADLDHLHDAPVRGLSWQVASPKEFSFVAHVPADADGPFSLLRGRWVRVLFRDPFFARLAAVGHVTHGEEFDGYSAELEVADEEYLRRQENDGYRVPPVRVRFALTSGTEAVVACESIEVMEVVADSGDSLS
jgi:hypothetical protein